MAQRDNKDGPAMTKRVQRNYRSGSRIVRHDYSIGPHHTYHVQHDHSVGLNTERRITGEYGGLQRGHDDSPDRFHRSQPDNLTGSNRVQGVLYGNCVELNQGERAKADSSSLSNKADSACGQDVQMTWLKIRSDTD